MDNQETDQEHEATEIRGWIELPYRIGVTFEETIALEGTKNVPVRLSLRNDLVKAYAADFVEAAAATNAFIERLRRDKAADYSLLKDHQPAFVSVPDVQELKARQPSTYCEQANTVLQFVFPWSGELLPKGLVPELAFQWLDKVITAYRLAATPAMRYSIHPISVADAPVASYEHWTAGPSPRVMRRTRYHFDVRSGFDGVVAQWIKDFNVEARFLRILSESHPAAEAMYALTFPLMHEHRLGEALLLASAAADETTRDLVAALVGPDVFEPLWKQIRGRHEDIFKIYLPLLGIPKLAETNPELWRVYWEARNQRHQVAHGAGRDQMSEAACRRHLNAIYDVIQWMIAQSNGRLRRWQPEYIAPEDGKPLRPFV